VTLALAVINVTRVLLAVLALRGARWAYVTFIVTGLAYFPMRAGFRLDPHACELAFGPRLAALSLTNYPHEVLFALFFVLSAVHFGGRHWAARPALVRAAVMTLAMGALVELAEGITGRGHCRLRDLIPDSVGALAGAAFVLLADRARRRLTAAVRKAS
jgi:hypothetical protein